jgi:hypothetical protein
MKLKKSGKSLPIFAVLFFTTAPMTVSLVPAQAAPQSASASRKVGDKVEARNVTWCPATIIEIGSGEYSGYYKVHYEGFSNASDQWIKASNIRSAAKTAAATDKAKQTSSRQEKGKQAAASAPHLGKYLIYSYGASDNIPLFLGHFELQSGGRYRASRRSSGGYYGSGRYSYDAATQTIKWLSGPYLRDKWGGKFSVTREGKTHRIELRLRTVATNSTDS